MGSSGWNRPSAAPKVAPKKSPALKHGILAFALAASIVWAFLGSGADDNSPLDRRQFYGDRAHLKIAPMRISK